ncbi:alpha/beta hydrolase, partial [Sphingorhabdus sp.]|uniref:alpha/beta hydrolase n=1 Tax=Sphingorhabdus sp. TaxID=1902408 RepID=UPI00391C266E
MQKTPLLFLLLLLAGCTVAVEYGDVPHSTLAENPRCNPEQNGSLAVTGKDYFIVTSRLPDCRSDNIQLTNHRGDRLRYAKFSPPQKIKPAKGDAKTVVPLAFRTEADWWAGLRDAANLRKGRVLLYVHGYRETLATTARDAVQIGAMSNFDGPVIHYSWPSQGNLLS